MQVTCIELDQRLEGGLVNFNEPNGYDFHVWRFVEFDHSLALLADKQRVITCCHLDVVILKILHQAVVSKLISLVKVC